MDMRVAEHIIESIEFLKRKYYWAVEGTEKMNTVRGGISQNSIELTMGWSTLYITGKGDFREEVREKLEQSNLKVMPGYTGMVSEEEVHDLYWVDDKVNVRDFKAAIGSKLIWNYRLHFFPSFEAFIESQNKAKDKTELTAEELAMIAGIKTMVK
jgi:hypothetical protein